MTTLQDAPLGPQLLHTDWTRLRVVAALLTVVSLTQVLKIQQLAKFLPQLCLTGTFVSHQF